MAAGSDHDMTRSRCHAEAEPTTNLGKWDEAPERQRVGRLRPTARGGAECARLGEDARAVRWDDRLVDCYLARDHRLDDTTDMECRSVSCDRNLGRQRRVALEMLLDRAERDDVLHAHPNVHFV